MPDDLPSFQRTCQRENRKNLNRTDSCLTTTQLCTLLDLFHDYTNIRDVQKAVRHRTQLTENTSFDYSFRSITYEK